MLMDPLCFRHDEEAVTYEACSGGENKAGITGTPGNVNASCKMQDAPHAFGYQRDGSQKICKRCSEVTVKDASFK